MQESAGGIVPGTVVAGQYRIEATLGEGGYGAVYAAIQLNLGRRVALKLLHPDVITRSTALARFKREAQLAQGLSHPNTVRLFDFGEVYGRPYIAYEYLDGRSLEGVIAVEGRLAPRRVARIASQTLKALIEAHENGIVHRDIKPGNLFICNFAGEPDFVKVLDFGIASSRTPGDGSALTQEGTTLGTPAYMAPEQALALPLDGRADLYSVGLVMAEALSGRRVFEGATAMEILVAQASDKPVPLPDEVFATPLGGILRAATMKNREHRFPTARAMLDAIEAASTSLSGTANAQLQLPHAPVVITSASLPREATPALQHAQTAYATATPPPAAIARGSTLSGSAFPGGRPAQPRSSALPVIAAILGIALVALAGFGVWAVYTYQSAVEHARHAHTDKARTADTHASPSTPLPKARATLPDYVAGCTLRGKTAQQILDRMSSLGWELEGMTDTDLGFGRQATFTYSKDDDTAVLRLSRSPREPTVLSPGEKYVFDNGCVVRLMATNDDGDLVDAPLDSLF